MWRVVSSTVVALSFFSSVAAAQQPCTTDAGRVVSEIYRHMLERSADPGAQGWQNGLAEGRMTVRDVVRGIVTSQEHQQRFGQTEAGEGTAYERAVARLYRHILGRQPDQGAAGWAQRAQQNGINAVADALLSSQEYSNNFGDWGVPGSGGIRFCATNNQSSNVAPEPAPLPRNQGRGNQARVTEPRFRGMDRNNDGTITRNEWQGSRQSFDVHDWDGNGVLEGNEVRQGAFRQGRNQDFEDFDRAEEFEFLDVNNNNRIERREWHASLESFNRMDTNRDGVLSRAEAQGWGDAPATVGTAGQEVRVDSRVRWVDTGINVRAGQTLAFEFEGRVRLSDNPNDVATAAGSASGRRAPQSLLPSAPAGGLIASIGNGAPVFVGDRRAVRAPQAGRLYLAVNDDYLADNDGDFRVWVDAR
jgi:Ca2+-binding EF-hand superfamily protein